MTDLPPRDPAVIVAHGYDRLGPRYVEWAAGAIDAARERWIGRLVDALPTRARLLDLGCGSGEPTARLLAQRFDVTGVDISSRQIDAARASVPSARFLVADMTTVEFPAASFDAVLALYSLIHVPLAELPALLRTIHDWLAPGGLLLATLGTVEGEAMQPDWLGVPMFFAGHRPDRNVGLLSEAGFELVDAAVETTHEPGEGDIAFHWLLALRP